MYMMWYTVTMVTVIPRADTADTHGDGKVFCVTYLIIYVFFYER